MARATRARTAETPKQPSPHLRPRAPHFYPDVLRNWTGRYCANQGSATLLCRWPIEEFVVTDAEIRVKTRGWLRLVYTGDRQVRLAGCDSMHEVTDEEVKTWFVAGAWFRADSANGTRIAVHPGAFTRHPERPRSQGTGDRETLAAMEDRLRQDEYRRWYVGVPFSNDGGTPHTVRFLLGPPNKEKRR